MTTKRNLIGILISAVFSISGATFLLFENEVIGTPLLSLGNIMAFVFGLIMILAHSEIVGTKYWKIILLTFIASNILGFLPAVEGINLTYIFIPILLTYLITYLIWFAKKSKLKHLDILKLLWIIAMTLIPILVFFKAIPDFFIYAGDIILWVLIIDFILLGVRNKNLIKLPPTSNKANAKTY
jgi:hypothetical protein